jgi:3-deoxy-7-phosphoheptulonate synthase
VLDDVAQQLGRGSRHVLGVMFESNLRAGRQDLRSGMARRDLEHGVSITDACVDLDSTERMLIRLARAVRSRDVCDVATT